MSSHVIKYVNTFQMASRAFSCSSTLGLKQWRTERGLSVNRNAEGVLTDAPDYTFLDGRPTPLLHKQKQRLERHERFAAKIIECNAELAHAKELHQKQLKAKEEERQRVISGRLKPKGRELLKKK